MWAHVYYYTFVLPSQNFRSGNYVYTVYETEVKHGALALH